MYNRVLQIDVIEEDSVFLFGARQTGKSTLLQQRFPNAMYIDLLKSDLQNPKSILCKSEKGRSDHGSEDPGGSDIKSDQS